MEDSFLFQFLSQAWRLIAILVVLIIIAIFAWRRELANRKKKIQQRRAEQDNLVRQTNTASPSKARASRSSQPPAAQDDIFATPENPAVDDLEFEPIRTEGSIFDDDSIFADDDIAEESIPADPVPQKQLTPEPQAPVTLGKLLTEDPTPEPTRDYHTVLDTPIAIQLSSKDLTLAQEVLSILRDERDKRLMVQMDAHAYRTLVDDDEARRFFTKTMKALSAHVLKPDDNPPTAIDTHGAALHTVASDVLDVQVASGGETTAREMLSIMRDQADGHYLVQIGKLGYRSLSGNDRAKKAFAKVMKELSTVILKPDDNPPPVSESSGANYMPEYALDVETEEPLPGDITMRSVDDLPDAYEVGRFGRLKIKKVEQKVAELDIAGAIEEYLQYKIQYAPEFQKRGIHIRSAYGGGVRIEIEGRTYEFVDDVEPENARLFIKQAIAEWQERH